MIVILHAADHLNPDAAVLLLTLGALLIYVELNRPGWVVPGAVGLLLDLFAAASLLKMPLSPVALAVTFSGLLLLSLPLFRKTTWLVSGAAALALVLGLEHLVRSPSALHVHAWVATGCGLVLGGGTSVLTRIARRARANKAVD